MKESALLQRLINWRIAHVSDRTFLIFLSSLVGVVSGLMAVGIKVGIHHLHALLTDAINHSDFGFWYLILPFGGVVLSVVLIQYFYKGAFAHGITNVLYAISRQSSIVKIRDAIYFMLGSVFTVGLGGSVGMEATLVMTGSSLGSNLARLFQLKFSSRVLLLGCGAASALSCFFHAPVAGVVFALEVLMLDLTMSSLVPLLLASVIGAVMSKVFLGENIILDFSGHPTFDVDRLPFYLLLGIICGGVSLYFSWVDRCIHNWGVLLGSPWKKALFFGGIAALLIYAFPQLFGEGYGTIDQLIDGKATVMFEKSILAAFDQFHVQFVLLLVIMVLVKAWAVALTLSSGGIGGYFAPSLFLGGITGFIVARLINVLNLLEVKLSEVNFTLVGMAGVMSSIFYAPLTAVFLIAEITKGYDLIVPLMVVSATAYLLVHYTEPHSLFTRRLASRGELLTHDKDRAALSLLRIDKIIEKDFKTTHPDATFREFLRDAVALSRRNIFPVVDGDGKLVSVILLDDARPYIFKQEEYDQITVKELMHEAPAEIKLTDSISAIMDKFDQTEAWNLPVVDDDRYYQGFISKSKLLSAYRNTMVSLSYE